MLSTPFAFVDVETTGTNPRFDRIIEVGILLVENGVITTTYSTLINPRTHLPPEITRITGITTEDLLDAPEFSEVKEKIYNLLEGAVLVAHNARFDYGFLKHEFARHETKYSAKQLCTVRLSRALFPELQRHNLDALITHFNLPCEKRHRALDDAKAMYYFMQHAEKKPEYDDVITRLMKKASVPVHLRETDLEILPESAGVYLFFGESDLPLYIGKSKNIKDRVLSHFADDMHSKTEMKLSQQVQRIEHRVTAGELGALFLESQLIKSMLPLYNKRLRNSRKMLILKRHTNEHGYETVTREPFISGDALGEIRDILGIFRSDKDAKEFLYMTAKDYSLCPKLLGLEKTSTACFYHRLGYCPGACEQKEPSVRYNMRMTTAFTASKLMHWPFTGPVAIEEKSPDGITEYTVIDNWCYLGSIRIDQEGNRDESHTPLGFDLDTYKILRSFLKNSRYNAKIVPLSKDILSEFATGL